LRSPPQLALSASETEVVLSWPTNAIGFTLQSTPNLVHPNWTTNSADPVIVNRRYVVTNLLADTQRFFRLAL
jgi:hypothetical protein